MDKKFLILIVVYGRDPFSTETYLALKRIAPRNARLIIWDNSPAPFRTECPAGELESLIISTPENLGLSVIYNRVIAGYLRDDEYLLLLDQDSGLPQEFLNQAARAITAHPDIDLFLPMVRANDRWVSPLTFFGGWGRYWDAPKVGRMASKGLAAINSGMIVSARYLKGDFPGYDQRIQFYGTDTQFIVDYAERRRQLCVFESVIEHDLSFYTSSGEDRRLKFLAMKSAYKWIYEGRPWWRRLLVAGVMFFVSARYALKFRSVKYLRRS